MVQSGRRWAVVPNDGGPRIVRSMGQKCEDYGLGNLGTILQRWDRFWTTSVYTLINFNLPDPNNETHDSVVSASVSDRYMHSWESRSARLDTFSIKLIHWARDSATAIHTNSGRKIITLWCLGYWGKIFVRIPSLFKYYRHESHFRVLQYSRFSKRGSSGVVSF